MIKFDMTSIGYGENYSEQMGIPGANINEVSSAFTQIQFEQGGSRNMGGNGNQPLITNLGTCSSSTTSPTSRAVTPSRQGRA